MCREGQAGAGEEAGNGLWSCDLSAAGSANMAEPEVGKQEGLWPRGSREGRAPGWGRLQVLPGGLGTAAALLSQCHTGRKIPFLRGCCNKPTCH